MFRLELLEPGAWFKTPFGSGSPVRAVTDRVARRADEMG
jgi:hypothetical protein